jgi:hypothetical protein
MTHLILFRSRTQKEAVGWTTTKTEAIELIDL